MDVRQKVLAELKAKYPYYTLKSNLLACLFFSGAILIIWEINIYRETFIPVYIPLSIWLLTGILITPFFKKTFNIYCFNQYTPGKTSMFFHYMSNVVSFGGILVFFFMWINRACNDNEKNVVVLPVVSNGHLSRSKGSCGLPYVHVIYQDMEKELIFSCGTEVENFDKVYVETVGGFFGFDVITRKTLVEGQW